METTLNAVINKPGEYEGFSANYSGAGFSHMRFKYRGVSAAEFDNWVRKTKAEGGALKRADYLVLEKPSEREPVRHYGAVAPNLYNAILNRCVLPGTMCMSEMMDMDSIRVREDLEHKEQKERPQPMSMESSMQHADAAPSSHAHFHKQ
jgi:cytochrome o ubiquinol oxidase subunit 2